MAVRDFKSFVPPRDVPMLGEPGKVVGLTLLVSILCNQCDGPHEPILLVAPMDQKAVCPVCGALYGLDAVAWDRAKPLPRIVLNSSPPAAQDTHVQ